MARLLVLLATFAAVIWLSVAVGIDFPAFGPTFEHIVRGIRSLADKAKDVEIIEGKPGSRIKYFWHGHKFTATYFHKTRYLKLDGPHDLLIAERGTSPDRHGWNLACRSRQSPRSDRFNIFVHNGFIEFTRDNSDDGVLFLWCMCSNTGSHLA